MSYAKPTMMSGVLARLAANGKSFLLENDEQWYSAFSPVQLGDVSEGDNVTFSYTINSKGGKDYYNVKGNLTVNSDGPNTAGKATPGSMLKRAGEPGLHRERLILNQNALTQAVAFWNIVSKDGNSPTEEDILLTAAKFVAWTSGDTSNMAETSSNSDPSPEAWDAAIAAFDGVKVA